MARCLWNNCKKNNPESSANQQIIIIKDGFGFNFPGPVSLYKAITLPKWSNVLQKQLNIWVSKKRKHSQDKP